MSARIPFQHPEALLDPWFHVCLGGAARNRELVAQFDRLNGTNLSRCGMGLEIAVDDATGRTDEGIAAFLEFVHDCIYTRVARPSEAA